MNVLFEDHHLIAVNKPAPLLTQAPEAVPCLEKLVKAYIKEKYTKPAGVYLGVPHRLDRPVSGAIVFTRNTKATQRMTALFERHEVKKTYFARVRGIVSPAQGTWVDWMRKVPDQPRAEACAPDTAGAKRAELDYKVLESIGDFTVLELSPRTGRMHQIRLQAGLRGHAVLGDAMYGSAVPFGPPAERERNRVIALHGMRLEFPHPFTQEPLILEAPLPGYWDSPPAD